MTTDFSKTVEARFQRQLRADVRKSALTRSEKDVLIAFLNHWFHHRHKGPVHPGRKKLAKRANVHINSVKATLAMLREFGAIEATAFLFGKCGNATEYTVSLPHLEALCRTPKVALKAYRAVNRGPKMSGSREDKKCPPSYDATVIPFPIQGRA
jgi:hypothetical protein